MKLQEIADVSIGVLISRESGLPGENTYKLFNIKNYDNNEEYEEVKTLRNLDNKLTQKGDLLIRLVAPNRIIYVDEKTENLLVPSHMCIIRGNRQKVNSEFLKWYLESDEGKSQMAIHIIGSSIQKISVIALRELEIPIIDIEKQNAIADLIKLWEKQKETLSQIIKEKEALYNNLIMEIIEKEG